MLMTRKVKTRSAASRTMSLRSSVWMPSPRVCTTTSPTMRTKAVRAARLRGQRGKRRSQDMKRFSFEGLGPAHSSGALHCRGENVAAAAHGLDQLGAAALVVELAAKPAHRHVDRPVEGPCLTPPQQIEQHVPRQN